MSTADVWAVVPAAGRGARFGGEVPKQYLSAGGRTLLEHALRALLSHPRIAGAVVALAPHDPHWPGWTSLLGKPVLHCIGGGQRADSVLAALDALPPGAGDDTLVLVHDAARPNLQPADLDALIAAAQACAQGAILAAPVRDTLKRANQHGAVDGTQSREGLWRALTPQAARRGLLAQALRSAREAGMQVTDEAMALEHIGQHPMLVEGREDNLKVTTPADLAVVEFLLQRREAGTA